MLVQRFLLALSLAGSFTSFAAAGPISFQGSMSSVWSNPTGAPTTGAGTNWLRFGTYDAGSLGIYTHPTFGVPSGTPFSLGTIYLTDGSSMAPPQSVALNTTMTFNQPSGVGTADFSFLATLSSSTPNANGGTLTANFAAGQSSSFVASNGETYTLSLVGLSNSWQWSGKTTTSLTASPTCYNNQSQAWVWAEITASDPGAHVPEPSSLVILCFGLVVVAGFRVRHFYNNWNCGTACL